MKKISSFEAYVRIDDYEDCPYFLENTYRSAAAISKKKYLGCALPKSHFTSIYNNNDVTKIFVGLGGEEGTAKTEYTFLLAGLDNNHEVVPDQRYNYGNQYPPKKLEGWDSCFPSISAEDHCKFSATMKLRSEIFAFFTNPVLPDTFNAKIEYYHNNLDRLYHIVPTTAFLQKFYGVIIPKNDTKLIELITSANVTDIVIMLGRTNRNIHGVYNLVFIGLDAQRNVICDRCYYSDEYASIEDINNITGLSLDLPGPFNMNN